MGQAFDKAKVNILNFLKKRTWLTRGKSPSLSIKRTLENQTVFCVDCEGNRILMVSALGNLICSSCGSENWTQVTNLAGRYVSIKGEITAEEDVTADGRVEGKIEMKDHHLVVGLHGNVNAEIHAKDVTIRGKVLGNIYASGLVEIKSSGSVVGDIKASRISFADGACFKGSAEMERSAHATEKLDQPKVKSVKIGHHL